ncbi:phosphate ABC transporter substrate-binding protein, PhoT family [Leptolyngbyaceae cyanobacterium JSC-12]|nr:phosphate ABC transporter substrate-binding protein, PhoT family [Leptolyngbyaceae cyanobacterium JSC-12]
MVKKVKAPSPIPYVATAIALLSGGYWWFNPGKMPSQLLKKLAQESIGLENSRRPAIAFPMPQSVPANTVVDIDGSTSMVTINQSLKRAFEQKFPGTEVLVAANGSNRGIQTLQTGMIDIAAISRPLTAQEQAQGLQAVEITNDAIAIVVGNTNPFKGSLTSQQVQGIFQGTIVNWSQVGGPNKMIRVINRPPASGTHQAFKDQVLKGGNFGSTLNITTLPRDATTPLLRSLGTDGIGYATDAQVVNQTTVRVVAIDGLRPDQPAYPYRRTLFYAYQAPASSVVQAFLGFALSAQGKQAMLRDVP